MTRISCVIPTHRRASYLREALASVASQTRPVTEVIVVSDVEDEATASVCADYQAAGMALTYVVSQAHGGGASASRNAGAQIAAGETIAFLDDDDLWAPEYIQEAMAAAERHAAPLVVTWLEEFSEAERQPGPRMPWGLRAQEVAATNPGATGSNMLISGELFRRIDGFDVSLRVKNDTDFLFRAMRTGASYAVVERELVFQRKHQSGQLTAKTETRAAGTEIYLAKHLAALTAADVRALRQHVHRIRARSSPTPWGRAYHAAAVMMYHTPGSLVARLTKGPGRRHIPVAAFESPEPARSGTPR